MKKIATVSGAVRRLGLPLLLAASMAGAGAAETPVYKAAQDAMWWGDFGALERQHAVLKQPGSLAPDASSNLNQFRSGAIAILEGRRADGEPFFKEMDALTLQWAQEHPASPLAHILHAEALVAHAWSYRGGGYAKDVPPEAWKDFGEYLRRAVAYLQAHADIVLADSSAHVLLLKIGRGLGWEDKQLDAIRREGLKRNPEDIELHFSMLRSLLPKWGGNPRTLDNYIKKVAAETSGQFGTGMYARLYATAADEDYGHTLFENSYADWDKMKVAFDDMLSRYPDSPKRRNTYAYMACLAKDKDTALRLLGVIGKEIDLPSWGPNPERSLEGCRRWAGQT